jgi:hypothetical protein
MKPFFKPEDFVFNKKMFPYEIAEHAEKLLQKRGVRVFGFAGQDTPNTWYGFDTGKPTSVDTHSALLVCLEPLAKADCEHFPETLFTENKCKHCGVKLRAKWESAE